jgi:hypothetical protein
MKRVNYTEAQIQDAKIVEKLSDQIKIESIYDLVNTNIDYAHIIPTLIQLLKSNDITNLRIKEGIIRALAVKQASSSIALDCLLDEYIKYPIEEEISSYRWAIGNTVNFLISKKDIEYLPELMRIAANQKFGFSRQMIVLSLGKFKTEVVENVLISLLHQEDVIIHTINALIKLKSIRGKTQVSHLFNHSNKVISSLAKRYSETVF